ncbi:ion channel [soil metagenome]
MAFESENVEREGVFHPEPLRDLGLGTRAPAGRHLRLLNRDGIFNVSREGLPYLRSLSVYHALLTISWSRFLLIAVGGFIATNLIFGLAYLACGPDAIAGVHHGTIFDHYLDDFFFSVHTLGTIGYGSISPATRAANIVVTIESLTGLIGTALMTGLFFARFSRPVGKIEFSRNAVVGPYRGGSALMFRLVNMRDNQLLDGRVRMLAVMTEERDGHAARRFAQLDLERESVAFLSLNWTVVHPINETSPLRGLTEQDFHDRKLECIILFSAIDETFSQAVHSRTSYDYTEIIHGAKFSDMYIPSSDGSMKVDVRRLHDHEAG